ncbi:GNAT family N-acetyltransferase [Sphingosinicella sp.]|uniref:GNAT family N-acetyltransferase n=1 Tax=Sphingosinicella sp. TaxID=1917971 RepID=UPI004037CE62
MNIRLARPDDRAAWEPLWAGYLEFYNSELPRAVTDTTWARFHDPAEPMTCLVAEDENGALIGFTHLVFHRGTWSVGDFCYLEDLFVAERARGRGAARALIEAVYDFADQRGAERVYWLTHETNTVARKLYDQVARHLGFIQYRR